MRFLPGLRHEPFKDTSRKRAALRRKQARERDALPLLAEQIAEAQPAEDAVMRRRAAQWHRSTCDLRDRRAQDWRKARALIAQQPPARRAAIRAAWDAAPYPAGPVNLLCFLHDLSIGRQRLDALSFDLRPSDPHGRKLHRLTLTAAEAEALRACASRHGPAWKARLIERWTANSAEGPLRGLYFTHGATWLRRLDLGTESVDA